MTRPLIATPPPMVHRRNDALIAEVIARKRYTGFGESFWIAPNLTLNGKDAA